MTIIVYYPATDSILEAGNLPMLQPTNSDFQSRL